MSEKPILMCGEMVRAILAGKKTETRRVAKGIPNGTGYVIIDEDKGAKKPHLCVAETECGEFESDINPWISCPYGVAGDTLWVRETWGVNAISHLDASVSVRYRAGGLSSIDNFRNDFEKYFDQCFDDCKKLNRFVWDNQSDCPYRFRPSIHMPRWASRITLTVKNVTLERLHEITEEGAKAEGVTDRAGYERLWKELNGEESWNINPWVWVVKFEVMGVKK